MEYMNSTKSKSQVLANKIKQYAIPIKRISIDTGVSRQTIYRAINGCQDARRETFRIIWNYVADEVNKKEINL